MKKLFLINVLIAAAIILASCGGNKSSKESASENEVGNESLSLVLEKTATDEPTDELPDENEDHADYQTEENDPTIYAPLIKAIETNDESAFDELITKISNINSLIPENENESDNFYSLLGFACKYKCCHLAEKLIRLNADVETGASDEYLVFDALSVAVESQDLCLVKLLLDNGANPNRMNSEEGFTVLSLSCRLNNYDIAKLLIESGAEVDGAGDTGFDYIHYPLLHAVESNNIKLVQLLIDNNCTVDVKDKQDETPFTIAERNNNQQMIDLLRQAMNR